MNSTKTGAVVSALVAAALASSAAVAAEKYTMKIGMATINDSNHVMAKWMAEDIAKRTNGRLEVKVFPAAQLGTIPRQVEGIQLGTQEAFLGPPGFLIGLNQAFMVTDAPGVFDSIAHQSKALNHDSFRDKFFRLAEDKGVVGNAIWSCGDTSINTVKPFEKLADLKGKKIRVLATPIERAVMEKLGATGVPMPYTEVLPGMQRGTIDGVRTGVIVMYPSKFYTVAKYLNLTALGHISCGQWLSAAWLKKLPSDLQKAVFDSGRAVTPHVIKWGEEMTRAAEKKWVEAGGKVNRLPEAERKWAREAVASIGPDILGKNEKTQAMFTLMLDAVKATRNAK